MFDMKLLADKVIFDHSELIDLRSYYTGKSHLEYQPLFSENALNDALSAHLNEHLRGIEFSVRQILIGTLIKDYLLNDQVHRLSYYDVALMLLSLELPTKQLLKNVQGWILMSTEYALPEQDLVNSLNQSKLLILEEVVVAPESEILEAEALEPLEDVAPVPILSTSDAKIYFSLNQWLSQYKVQFRYGFIIGMCGILLFSVVLKLENRQARSFDFRDMCYMLHKINYKPKELEASVKIVYETSKVGIPSYLQFNVTDTDRLKGYLKRNNSMLANDPYFSAIIDAAAKMDINPLLLFAITGQEQGFVKRGSVNAALIVNNPFNVYHSWVDYNTNIKDSALIAANTVSIQLEKRPAKSNPFKWLNQVYAEDPKWHLGVEQIFLSLDSYCNIE